MAQQIIKTEISAVLDNYAGMIRACQARQEHYRSVHALPTYPSLKDWYFYHLLHALLTCFVLMSMFLYILLHCLVILATMTDKRRC